MTPEISDVKIIQIKKHVQKYQPQIGLMQIVNFIADCWPKDQAGQEWIVEASPKSIGDWVMDGIESRQYEKTIFPVCK